MGFQVLFRSPGTSLSRKIFLSLIWIIVFSLFCFGVFWFNERIDRFHAEIVRMKKSFSENKRLEIRNKILQIKDYIRWINHTPDSSVSMILARQVRQLASVVADSGAGGEEHEEQLVRLIRDREGPLQIPVAVYHRSGRLVYEDHRGMPDYGGILPDRLKTLTEEAGRGRFGEPQRITFISAPGRGGGRTGALTVDTAICRGYRVVLTVPVALFDPLLRQFLLDSISRMRYAVNEYVFVNTLQGEALVTHGHYNPKPIRILSSGDTSWIRIFNVQRLSAYRPEGVFHTYRWNKLSSDTVSVKTSYFSYLHDWQWIIGTGYYEDDIRSLITRQRDELRRQYRNDILTLLLFLLTFSLLSYVLVILFSRRLRRNMSLFTSFFTRSAEESVLIDVSQVSFGEFRVLAHAANRMVQQRKEVENELRDSEMHYRLLSLELENRVRERTRQLEATNKELESFSYSVSHDLRAPLRAIQGYAAILMDEYKNRLDAEGHRMFRDIMRNTSHLNNLIDALLALSRIGKTGLTFSPIGMKAMAETVFGELTAGADVSRIRFSVAEIPAAHGDPVLIRQVWTNLLSNALKYSSRREPAIIEVGWHSSEEAVVYEVRDNGVGFDAARAGKLFEAFQRFHSVREYEGTGVGLATVDRIIRRHGGRVWAESEPDKGATFFFTLPG